MTIKTTTDKVYEVPIWFRSENDQASEENTLAAIRHKLTTAGATVLHETKAVKRRLAYPIAKLNEALFVVFEVTIDPSGAHKARESFRHDPAIIRLALLKKIDTESKAYPVRQTARPRLDQTPSFTNPKVSQLDERPAPEVKMEDLEKKLEEILKE